MFVVTRQKKIGVKHCALLAAVLFAQHSAFALPGRDSIFFQATNVPVSGPAIGPLSTAYARGGQNSVGTFEPVADAADVRALIARLEEKGDFYSPEIAGLAEQLGRVLQAEGQHVVALETFDRSFQVMRRQQGLASTAQASLLQAMFNSQLALGDMEAADALQQSLLTMQHKVSAGKPVALAEAQLNAADWNMQYYLRAMQTPVPGGRTEQQLEVLTARLGEAFMQYHEALWLLSTAAAGDLYEQKVAIERKIAALTLMVERQHQRDFPNTLTKQGQRSIHQSRHSHNPVLSRHGNAALQRAIGYSVATAKPVLIAERQLELADWYLLMDQPDEARATYATAVASLRDAGVQEQQIAAILEPGLPVQDPEAALLALAGNEPVRDFDGYIDVSFDLNRYGKASNTRVLAGASYDASVEEVLLRQIHDGIFRPAFEQGEPVDHAEVTLRYYFAR